jgi:hypothetical protein
MPTLHPRVARVDRHHEAAYDADTGWPDVLQRSGSGPPAPGTCGVVLDHF